MTDAADRRKLLKVFVGVSAANTISPGQGFAYDSLESENHNFVDATQFGAKCDGKTDDSAAIQKAINACISAHSPSPLLIRGPCRIDKSIIIDRPVDTSLDELVVVGLGRQAGFYLSRPITLFDSSLGGGSRPQSEYIRFENISFVSKNANGDAFVMSGKFLRVKFVKCHFYKIKCVESNIYTQEWRFENCIVRWWDGIFFKSAGGYNIVSHGTKYQNGGSVFSITDKTARIAGCVGCSFIQDIYEGCTGEFLRANSVLGLSVAGLYAEGNAKSSLIFDGPGTNRGINISGSFFAPPEWTRDDQDFFEIRWGNTISGHSSGNYCTTKLHDDGYLSPGCLFSIGDYAEISLLRSNKSSTKSGNQGLISTQNNIVAYPGGGLRNAILLTKELNRIIASSSPNDSVRLPSVSITDFGLRLIVINFAPMAIRVHASDGDTINGVPGARGVTQESGVTRTYYCAESGKWNF